ncbi:RHS repeat-associated core domain-containing protein [Psychroflexus sp. MBR-150]
MQNYRKTSHTTYDCKYHIVWITKPSSTTSDLIGPVNYNFSYDNFNRLTSASGSYTGPNDVVNTQSQGGNPFLKHEYNLDLTYDAQDPSRNFINKTQTHLNKPVSDLNEPMENASVVKNNSYQLDYTYDDDGGLIAGSNYGYTQPHAVREIKEQPTGVNCCDSQDDPRIKNQNIKHDANGNLTKVIEGIGEEEITKIHYLWDEENRLMAVDFNPYSEESDHPIATYTYDAGGERIIKYLYQQVDIHSNAKDVGNARKTETYIYPDGMITAKVLKFIVRDQALSYTKHYHIGSQRVASKIGTSERFGFYSEQIIPLANLANADGINLIDVLQDPDEDGQNFNHLNERRNRILQAFDIPPLESETDDISEDENVTTGSNNFAHGFAGDLQHVEVFYFHSDHLGSSNYMSNYDGDISQHAEYLPFGELLTDEHLNSHNTRYKYNGKEFDQETGNYYYGARYFNPKTSLWLSVDPLASEFPSWSPYNFTMNNPIRFIDPDGRAPQDIIVTTSGGKELFRLNDGKTEITRMTARQVYGRGIQWFESSADNYMPLISKAQGLSTFSELKHFSWNEIAEFAETDRWMLSYRAGGSGDWKADGKPGDGYLMVTVDGEPYWTDAVGQIPFAVDKFTDELESTGNASTARQKTIEAGQTFGDGNVIGGESDNTNSYDNAMIKRAINWAEKRYKVIKGSGWFGGNYDLQKTNHSPSNLSKQSDEKQ